MILYEEIFRKFEERGVKYIIVGGMAVNVHGYIRATTDLDILTEMSDDNLAKIVNILKEEGYKIKQLVDPIGIAEEKTRRDWIENKNMKALNFYKEEALKEVDIIVESPINFEAAFKTVCNYKISGITLPVISMDNLIKMKECSARDIDKLDLSRLRKIKGINGE